MYEKEILLEEVVSMLQTGLATVTKPVFLPTKSIRLMVDERIPPSAGDEFIGVYGGTSNNLNLPHHPQKRIEYGFKIGITRRCVGLANEHMAENALTQNIINRDKASILKRTRQVINVMQEADGWILVGAVNDQLVAEEYEGMFVCPPGLISLDDEPQTVTADHWDIKLEEDEEERYAGLFMELVFGGAEFYRHCRIVAAD